MNYEVVESAGAWIVRREGVEVGRFDQQGEALTFVGQQLKDAGEEGEGAASLSVRYERRSA